MKKSRFSKAQIVAVLRQAEGGMPAPDLCRAWYQQCQFLQMACEV
ncbi:hypothetical protein RHI9324_04939 [Rhizobium sp. CECT 9324]|nr:hypothetical protein RHI9324_04939 [Rhizobium sp. CECT 9324]